MVRFPQNNTGKIYFNLGEISEDVLKDGRKTMKMDLDQITSKTKADLGRCSCFNR
jgi:cell surface protein SprA